MLVAPRKISRGLAARTALALAMLASGSASAGGGGTLDVTVHVGEASQPAGYANVALISSQGSLTYLYNQDKTLPLAADTYTLTTAGGEGTFGTFTLAGSPPVITATTGALTFNGSAIDFDTQALAPVTVRASELSDPPGLVGLIVSSASYYIVGADTTLYLPPSRSGTSYLVETAAEQGHFGTFTITPSLGFGSVTGALSASGHALDFNRAALTQLELHSSDLSTPPGLVAIDVAGAAGYVFGTNPTVYLPANQPGTSYEIEVPGEQASFGTFTLAGSPPALGALTGALLALPGGAGVTFDGTKLARVHLPWRSLSCPAGLVPAVLSGVSAQIWYGGDPNLLLPPNREGRSYDIVTAGGESSFGTFTIDKSLAVSATSGYVVPDTGGFRFNTCGLPKVTVNPPSSGAGSSWFILEAAAYHTGPATVMLPPSGGAPYETGFFNAKGDVEITGDLTISASGGVSFAPIAGEPAPAVGSSFGCLLCMQ